MAVAGVELAAVAEGEAVVAVRAQEVLRRVSLHQRHEGRGPRTVPKKLVNLIGSLIHVLGYQGDNTFN